LIPGRLLNPGPRTLITNFKSSWCRIADFRIEPLRFAATYFVCFLVCMCLCRPIYMWRLCFVYEYVFLFICLPHSLSLSLSLLVTFDLPHEFEIHSTGLPNSCKRGLCYSLVSVSNKTNMASDQSFSSVTVSRVACEFNVMKHFVSPYIFLPSLILLYELFVKYKQYRLPIHRNMAWF
jgi:hypothetical protein